MNLIKEKTPSQIYSKILLLIGFSHPVILGKSCRSSRIAAATITLLLTPTLAFAKDPEFTQPISWRAHNRYLEVATGSHRQNYREQDLSGLTADGVLDTEIGNQNVMSIALRWQFERGWLLHLNAQHKSGTTHYTGYLQAGNTFTPYSAFSGNRITQYGIDIGYAMNSSTWNFLPERWQIAPLLHYHQHHWQRNLEQYGETYDHRTSAIGALLQYQLRPGTVLEVQVMQGQAQPSSIRVPTFGFAATQPGGAFSEWQLAASQDAGSLTGFESLKHWRITVRYTATRYSHAASSVVNGLQAPPNQNSPNSWLLGAQLQF